MNIQVLEVLLCLLFTKCPVLTQCFYVALTFSALAALGTTLVHATVWHNGGIPIWCLRGETHIDSAPSDLWWGETHMAPVKTHGIGGSTVLSFLELVRFSLSFVVFVQALSLSLLASVGLQAGLIIRAPSTSPSQLVPVSLDIFNYLSHWQQCLQHIENGANPVCTRIMKARPCQQLCYYKTYIKC